MISKQKIFLFFIYFLVSSHMRTIRPEENTADADDDEIDAKLNKVDKEISSTNASRSGKINLIQESISPELVKILPEHAFCRGSHCFPPLLLPICSPLAYCAAYYEEVQKTSSFCKIGTQGYGANCNDVTGNTLSANLLSKPTFFQSRNNTVTGFKSKAQPTHRRQQNFEALSPSETQQAFLAATQEVQRIEKFEQAVSPSGVVTDKNTPEFFHAQFFKTSPEAIEVSKVALAQNFASSSIKESLKLTPEEAVGKLVQTDASRIMKCPRPPICNSNDDIYRRPDGGCNNKRNPFWGKALTPFLRKTNFANYDDGLGTPRKSARSGGDLPSARLISSRIVKNLDKPSPKFTLSVMQWGQFVDHDLTHTPISTIQTYGGVNPIQCCGSNGLPLPFSAAHSQCFPIVIPSDDLFYSRHNQRCMNFVRSLSAPRTDCKLGPRNQMNQISHYLDGSAVYGSSESSARSLRSFSNGLLKEQGGHLLPNDPNTREYDFLAGDTRVNSQPHLSIVHTIWLRQHNRIANELKRINSANTKWNDEKIYQEARRIVVAQIQHIVYNEWLPIILGIETMKLYRLLPQSTGFLDYYSDVLDASINNEFATVGFRFGHTLIQGNLELFDEDEEKVSSWPLADNFNHPSLISTAIRFDELLRGLFKQPMQKFDRCFPDDITNHLFKTDKPFGLDLVSFNIQRGRDHGVGTYNDIRSSCGLPKVINFFFLDDNIDRSTIRILESLYEVVEDIDPFIAGVSERPYQGGIVGRLFNCIVSEQFQRLKYGDRFYYENGGLPSSFKEAQLNEIRKTSWARIICDNSVGVSEIQPLAFRLPDTHNKKVPCSYSAVIPALNLNHWKE